MALPATIGPKFVTERIAVQHNPRDFLPVRALCVCVEKTPVGDVVLFIVRRNIVSRWRFIVHIGIEFDGNPHSLPLHLERALLAVRPRKWPLNLVIGELVTVTRRPYDLWAGSLGHTP